MTIATTPTITGRHVGPLLPTSEYRRFVAPARAVLRAQARAHQVITYGALAEAIEFPMRRPALFFAVLATVAEDCKQAGEPGLSVLVVNARTRVASDGVEPWVSDPASETARVFAHADQTRRRGL